MNLPAKIKEARQMRGFFISAYAYGFEQFGMSCMSCRLFGLDAFYKRAQLSRSFPGRTDRFA